MKYCDKIRLPELLFQFFKHFLAYLYILFRALCAGMILPTSWAL